MTFADDEGRNEPFRFGQPQPSAEFLWIDQLAQEMLLTAQAFSLLQQAWAGRFMVVPS